jgi:hypothetical protein
MQACATSLSSLIILGIGLAGFIAMLAVVVVMERAISSLSSKVLPLIT